MRFGTLDDRLVLVRGAGELDALDVANASRGLLPLLS